MTSVILKDGNLRREKRLYSTGTAITFVAKLYARKYEKWQETIAYEAEFELALAAIR